MLQSLQNPQHPDAGIIMYMLFFRLKDVLEFAEDMEIDIPKVWQYLGELISPMVQDGCCLPLSFLREGCQPLESCGKGGTLVSAILHDASQRLVSHTYCPTPSLLPFLTPRVMRQGGYASIRYTS